MTLLHHDFRCMASDVTIDIAGPRIDIREKIDEAIEKFRSIEVSCTRFNPTSPLMLANANPTIWNPLPKIAIDVIRAAYEAYKMTEGVFDPRILDDLVKSGYDAKLRFDSNTEFKNEPVEVPAKHPRNEWKPEFRSQEVLLGDAPIDLGGIGKGYAVQSAMDILQDYADGVLINAGGDIAAEGLNDEEDLWRIGIENPWDPEGEPVRVVELEDVSIATSSIRLRSWKHDGRVTHHLIDPSTGTPGGEGLIAVSAIAASTSVAEIWSKTLFLKGLTEIEEFAAVHSIPALWIAESGNVFSNGAFEENAVWGVTRALPKK